jgi:hypothetical protein
MKRILILLFFVCSATFGQMTRSLPFQLKGTCIQYAPLTGSPKSVVIILPGIGELGTDPTVIESNIGVARALKAGTFSVNRIILFQQIPKAVNTNYYANTIGPLIAYANSFGLPVDFSGLSLGGMGVSLNLPFFKVRSAMTCPGNVEANKPADKWGPAIYYDSAYMKIPSIHYYSIGDLTIQNGYTSIKALVTKLKSWGKKDITIVEIAGNSHNVWDYAYSTANYWTWLDALDAPTVTKDPVVSSYYDGVNVISTTQSGKVLTLKPQ